MNRYFLPAAAVAVVLAFAPAPVADAQKAPSTAPDSSETYRQLNLFGDVFVRVRTDYVEEVSDEQLIENAINGMLTALDPHSSYLNAKS